MLIAGLLFIVREELVGMIHRGFLPSFFLACRLDNVQVIVGLLWSASSLRVEHLWLKRTSDCCFILPANADAHPRYTGSVHVSCDASHRDACWDALLSVISALLF